MVIRWLHAHWDLYITVHVFVYACFPRESTYFWEDYQKNLCGSCPPWSQCKYMGWNTPFLCPGWVDYYSHVWGGRLLGTCWCLSTGPWASGSTSSWWPLSGLMLDAEGSLLAVQEPMAVVLGNFKKLAPGCCLIFIVVVLNYPRLLFQVTLEAVCTSTLISY